MGLLNNFISLPLAGVQFICLALCLVIWRRWAALDDVPGPFWASITRLWHAKQVRDGTQKRVLMKLHDELGPFVRIAPDEISVAHPDALRKLLISPLRKGYWYEGLTFPDSTYHSAMSVVEPRKKMEMSKLLASAYTTSSLLQSETAIDRQIASLLKWMDEFAQSSKPMPLSEFFTFAAYDIMGEVIFSKPFGFLEAGIDIENSLRQGLEFGVYVAILPFFPWIQKILVSTTFASLKLLPSNFLIEKSVRALNERKKNPDARYDYVAHWLKAHKEQPDKLTAKDVQAAVSSNVSAGADTITCSLQSFVYHMIRHETAWARAREEIQAAIRDGSCRDPVISFADAQRLPYLQACIKEALRIFPPASMGLQRVVPAGGITIGERTFAAGTILSVYPPSIMLSPELWGPDARTFEPERWMRDDAAALDKYYFPFGLGYNSCVGQNLARIELSKILATIVRGYNIRQVDPKQEWSYKPYFTVVPGGWPVYVEKHEN